MPLMDRKMSFALSPFREIQQTLGQRLRRQRLAQGLSQQVLADMAGVSPGALRTLETRGQSSLETLVKVVQALGLTSELEPLFVIHPQSIARMELAEAARLRQRAPRQRSP